MQRPWRRAAAAAWLLGSFVLPSPARAENVDTAVEVRTCDASDAMVSAMRVELAATATSIAKLTVVCLPEARVLVVAFPTGGSHPVAREVDLADAAPDARTRAVAIATGELLRAIGADAPAIESPAPAPVPTPVPPHLPPPLVVEIAPPSNAVAPRPPASDAAPFAWSLGGALHARVLPMASTAFAGPALELDAALGQLPLRLRVASELGLAERALPAGEASLTLWTGSVALLARARAGALFLDAGPFVEGGGAFAEGAEPTAEAEIGSGSAPVALVGGEAILGARLVGPAVPFVAFDAGGVLAGIEAEVGDRAALALRGLFVGARVGVAVAP